MLCDLVNYAKVCMDFNVSQAAVNIPYILSITDTVHNPFFVCFQMDIDENMSEALYVKLLELEDTVRKKLRDEDVDIKAKN